MCFLTTTFRNAPAHPQSLNEQSCSLWSGLLKRPTESNYIGTNTIKLRLYKKLPSTKARLSPSCWSVVSCGILKGKMFQIVFLTASPQKSKIQETSWRSNCSLRRIVSNLGQYVSTNISNTRDSGSSGYPNIEKTGLDTNTYPISTGK